VVSGLKINYAKSDILLINISSSLSVQLADKLGCKTNSLPLTCLGILIHRRKPNKEIWNSLISKIQRKINNLQDRFLSWGKDEHASIYPICRTSVHFIYPQNIFMGEEEDR
jgi:hypothetical protein